jgi:hypothetical protein
MHWKLVASASSFMVLGGGLVYLALVIAELWAQAYMNLALLILGAASGWLVGIVVSPYTKAEETTFSTYTKAFTAFASGYAVAKIDKTVEAIFAPDFLLEPLAGFRVIAFVSSFLLSMLITFGFRSYAK